MNGRDQPSSNGNGNANHVYLPGAPRGHPQQSMVQHGGPNPGQMTSGEPMPWLTNPAVLREIFARGPGAYRLQFTIPPSQQTNGQQQPQFFQQGYHQIVPRPVIYPSGMGYFPVVPQQLYRDGIDPRVMGYPGYTLQEELRNHNPDRPPVTMVHAGRVNEQQETSGAKKRPRKRKRKDQRAPKPARYAWNFFFKERYQRLRKDGGDGLFDVQEAFTKVGLRLGNQWKLLSTEERKPYVEMAAKDRQRYEREMELYNKGLDFRTESKDKQKTPNVSSNEEIAKVQKTTATSKLSPAKESPVKAEGNVEKETDVATVEKSDTVVEKAQCMDPSVAHQVTADILVTDDDDAFIVMMEATLKRLHKDMKGKVNLNIHKAKSGTEALAKVEQQKYLVVTMDKEMGAGPDGVQTVKKMRESGYDGFVLGLSGNPDSVESFKTSGANASLTKGSSQLYNQIYGYVIEKLGDQKSKSQSSSADAIKIEKINKTPESPGKPVLNKA